MTIVSHCQDIWSNYTSGFYANEISIILETDADYLIKYTLDGSVPTINSLDYSGPIHLMDRSNKPNNLSDIRTNPLSTPEDFRWSPPEDHILKSNVIKAALFEDNTRVSEVQHFEYFVGNTFQEIDLPIMSMYIDSTDFFSFQNGIYVPGLDYDTDSLTWQPGNYFNRGDDWERVVNLRYYDDKKEVLYQKVEAEIHGGASRVMPCKSIRLSAKKSLGHEYIDYPFFDDKAYSDHKRLILRNSGQDWHQTLFLDVLMQELLADENIEYQSSQACLLFINGEYWGIHNLRERYDKHYFSNYHSLDKSNIDYFVVEMAYSEEEGSSQAYQDLIDMIDQDELTDIEKYDLIKNSVDLDNFITHHISKVYGGGTDWAGNNTRIWRSHETESKWRWVANDYDDAFKVMDKDSYGHATKDDGVWWPNPEWSTRMFRFLMTIDIFREHYQMKLEDMLNSCFSAAHIHQTIDSLSEVIRSEMPRQIARWNHPNDIDDWEANIHAFKSFADVRADFVLKNYQQYFPTPYEAPDDTRIYPNPADQILYIEPNSSYQEGLEYQILDILGRVQQSGVLQVDQVNELTLRFQAKGLFYIRIATLDREESFLITRL